MNDVIYDLWLTSIEGFGLRNQLKLLEIFGCSRRIFEGSKDILLEAFQNLDRMEKRAATNILRKDLSTAQLIIKENEKQGIHVVTIRDDQYPPRLLDIWDPPIVLYYKGDLQSRDKDAVAIVGARKATPYGKWVSESLGKKLADHGITVISGMAYGIDSASHKGALSGGGRTLAVLGCGPDICYPSSNRQLMSAIEENGAIISEFPPGTPPLASNFPRRNRIISGMARCMIVAEAGLSSGSLITAECALEQGKEVFAVPGNINSIYSIGTNKLIKDGATPLIRIADISLELGLENGKVEEEFLSTKLGRDERIIYEALKDLGTTSADALCKKTGKSVSDVYALVTILEIKGIVETAQGKIFIAK